MKSLTKIRSFAPSVLNAEMSSGSVYSFTVKECIGPRPLANHKTRTFKTSDSETIFSADKCGHLSLSHFLMTCGETPTFLARTSVSVTPAANIAAFSLAPNVGMNFPLRNKTPEIHVAQDVENKVSHFLSFLKFSFARRTRVTFLPVDTRFVPTASARLCRDAFLNVHIQSFPFFAQGVTGNSTSKEGYSHE